METFYCRISLLQWFSQRYGLWQLRNYIIVIISDRTFRKNFVIVVCSVTFALY